MATCTLSGTLKDATDTAISGATITFRIVKGTANSSATTFYLPKDISTTSATDGTWSLSLVQGITGTIHIDYNANTLTPSHKLTYTVTIPAATTAAFNTLATEV